MFVVALAITVIFIALVLLLPSATEGIVERTTIGIELSNSEETDPDNEQIDAGGTVDGGEIDPGNDSEDEQPIYRKCRKINPDFYLG